MQPVWHHGGLTAMAICQDAPLPYFQASCLALCEGPGIPGWDGQWAMDSWTPHGFEIVCTIWAFFHDIRFAFCLREECYGNPQLERSNPKGTNPCVHHMATWPPKLCSTQKCWIHHAYRATPSYWFLGYIVCYIIQKRNIFESNMST